MRAERSAGFTLIEVLVALAVLAVTLTAASRAIGMAVQSAYQVRQALLADWVAQNRLVLHRINRDWPGIGLISGSDIQGGIEFRWEEEVSATPHGSFRRIEVRVIDPADASRHLRRVVGYVARNQ